MRDKKHFSKIKKPRISPGRESNKTVVNDRYDFRLRQTSPTTAPKPTKAIVLGSGVAVEVKTLADSGPLISV